jgi:hypothetical protein
MTAQLTSIPHLPVYSADGIVHVRDLASADPDLLALVTGASDPEAVVQRALSTGARALVVAQVSVDTAVVETSFAALETQLRAMLENATARVTGTTTELLNDPERGICATLGSWKAEVSSLLEQTFDPQHSGSAVSKLDVVLRDASERQLSATRRLLNPDAEDSPLSRLMAGVRYQVATVLDAVARLAEQVAKDRASTAATAAAMERTAVKGMAFEDQVVAAVAALAAERGDAAEAVGRLGGAGGGRVGDIVVEIDPASNGGRSGAYVLECKDRRLSFKATMGELRQAADNRDARAAIGVFSRAEHAPIPAPFAVFDDRAIVVYDKDEPDTAALRLGCAWARWIVQRETRSTDANIDFESVGRMIDDARRALDRVNSIKRAHSAAAKKIGEAASQVAELNTEVGQALGQIERALTAEGTT